jgi:hypothetical protein
MAVLAAGIYDNTHPRNFHKLALGTAGPILIKKELCWSYRGCIHRRSTLEQLILNTPAKYGAAVFKNDTYSSPLQLLG